jgi:hypothetical protein
MRCRRGVFLELAPRTRRACGASPGYRHRRGIGHCLGTVGPEGRCPVPRFQLWPRLQLKGQEAAAKARPNAPSPLLLPAERLPRPPARQGHAGASLYSRPDPKTEPEDEHGTATPGPIIVATTLSCWAEAYLGSQHAQDTEQRAPVDGMRERTTRLPDRLEPGERRATEDQIVLIRCPGRRGVKAGAITSEATPSAVSCRYRSHPDTPEAQPEPTRSPATTARPSDQYARRRERDRPACQIGGGPYCVRIAAPIAPRVAPP